MHRWTKYFAIQKKPFSLIEAAKRFVPEYEAPGCRWAALRLRKASKELVQEMKQFHFVVRTRDFSRRTINWILVTSAAI